MGRLPTVRKVANGVSTILQRIEGHSNHTLLCISIPGRTLLQSRRISRGKLGDLYHLDWKQTVPAEPAVEFLTVS